MFCNQCEQRAPGKDGNPDGCTKRGVCGKTESLATLQDALIYALRGFSAAALKFEKNEEPNSEADLFLAEALFATLTNVNFSDDAIMNDIRTAVAWTLRFEGKDEEGEVVEQAALDAILQRDNGIKHLSENEDVCSAMQILLFGIKGLAAYTVHAAVLGKRDPAVFQFMKRALVAGMPDEQGAPQELTMPQWLELLLECGTVNVRAMELLETGHTEQFGCPVPTPVNLGHRAGKAIVVSGHDLLFLHELLKQTEGTGINIYTHGEMLPAHGYPVLKAFPHLVGHYGTAWQNQKKELVNFPGAVLFTTNCIQEPKGYEENVFTSGVVRFEGLTHCPETNFSAAIVKAQELPGFEEDVEGATVTVGFGQQTLLNAAPQVLEAVAQGALKHIFVVGGCDGAKPGRNYFTEFVEKTPQDTLVLTLGCGKYRFFDKDLGSLGPFPRLMDVGQCNDAYVAVKIALALADALKCTVNDLPLSLVISWYEQKAVVVFLSLLALGVKNITLGPSLPAFISPNILQLLVTQWGVRPAGHADDDLKLMLG